MPLGNGAMVAGTGGDGFSANRKRRVNTDSDSEDMEGILEPTQSGHKRSASFSSDDSNSVVDSLFETIRLVREDAMKVHKEAIELEKGGSYNQDPLNASIIKLLSRVSEIITRKGEIRTPATKKPKVRNVTETTEAPTKTPAMVDSATETPIWWAFDGAQQRTEPATTVRTEQADVSSNQVGVGNRKDTWVTVLKRKNNPNNKATTGKTAEEKSPTPAKTVEGRLGRKPPAVLVKLAPGKTYADTVRDLRTTSGLNPVDLGVKVKSMRRTREGHVLLELAKGAESQVAAGKLTEAISVKLGSGVGTVTQLGKTTEMEVVDIDAAADKEEVLKALQAAIPGDPDDARVASERQAIRVTGLWATRSGQQVATVHMSRAAASRIDRIMVGWTACRVRERRKIPARCYRCHGFGHSAAVCTGPDLSAACRRCGDDGHKEKTCTAGNERCVACERAGAPGKQHRPGSGACEARRTAQTTGGNGPRT